MSHPAPRVHYNRASCQLAADGTFASLTECESDTKEKCGWKYTCDELSSGFCKQVQKGGTWATKEECRCIGCFPVAGIAGSACSNQTGSGGKCGFQAIGGTYNGCQDCRCSTTAYASVFPPPAAYSGTRAPGEGVGIEVGRFVAVGNAVTLNGSGNVTVTQGTLMISYKIIDAATGKVVAQMISPNGGGVSKEMRFSNLNNAPQPFVVTPDAGFVFVTVNREYVVQIYALGYADFTPCTFKIKADRTVAEQYYHVDYVAAKPAWQDLGKPGPQNTVWRLLASVPAQSDHIAFEFMNDATAGVQGFGQVDIYSGSGTDRVYGSLALVDSTNGLIVAQAPISDQGTHDRVGVFFATTSQTITPSVPGRNYNLNLVLSSDTDDAVRFMTYDAVIRHFNYGNSTKVTTFYSVPFWPRGATSWTKVPYGTDINEKLGELVTGASTRYISLQGGGTGYLTGGSGVDYIVLMFRVVDSANNVVFQGLTGPQHGYLIDSVSVDRDHSPQPFTVTPDVAFFKVAPNTLYRFYLYGRSITDDSVKVPLNPLTVEEWQNTVTLSGSESIINLGNRMEQRDYYIPVGQYTNKPSFFVATGLHIDMLSSGKIQLGAGDGTDRLEASFVIKEGPPQNNPADAAAQPTTYQGSISRQATRNQDAFFFVNREESFIPVAVGQTYTVYVKLSIQSDDTVRVSWDPVVIVQYSD